MRARSPSSEPPERLDDGIDGEHRDRAPVLAPRAHERRQQRRLARAGRPGHPDQMPGRLGAEHGGGDLAQQRRDVVGLGARLDEVQHGGRRAQVTLAQAPPEVGARARHGQALAAATPPRSPTSATMSRMIFVRSKSLGV
jgi:hypothetical protein